MATTSDLLLDAFSRVQESVHEAVVDLNADELAYRVDEQTNSIAWLIWHLARVQDDHLADLAGAEQVWTRADWAHRFGLPFDPDAIGYAQSSDEVANVRGVAAELLTGYYDAVHAASIEYVRTLSDTDLDRVIDSSWDPPVTVAIRLVSVVNDDLQHVGQAALLRGIVVRRR